MDEAIIDDGTIEVRTTDEGTVDVGITEKGAIDGAIDDSIDWTKDEAACILREAVVRDCNAVGVTEGVDGGFSPTGKLEIGRGEISSSVPFSTVSIAYSVGDMYCPVTGATKAMERSTKESCVMRGL